MIGLYIILAVFAAFIFWIHSGHQKEKYGEDVIKNWPQAEGTINFTVSDTVGTHWYIDFIVNGQLLQGRALYTGKAGADTDQVTRSLSVMKCWAIVTEYLTAEL